MGFVAGNLSLIKSLIVVAIFFFHFSGMVTGIVFNKHKLVSSLERNQGMTGLLSSPDGGPFEGENSNLLNLPQSLKERLFCSGYSVSAC